LVNVVEEFVELPEPVVPERESSPPVPRLSSLLLEEDDGLGGTIIS
jgi:hypothetical protein